MQVQVEKTGSLGRKMMVQVAAPEMDAKVMRRLREIGKTASLRGFRPGKVPFPILEQKFGLPARQEVVEATIKETLPDALNTQSLFPVAPPVLTDVQSAPGTALEYAVTFEIFPPVDLQLLEQISIEKPVASVPNSVVETTIQKLRKAHADWHEVDRKALMGDRVRMSFTGACEDQEHAALQAKEVTVEIGTGIYLPLFEEALIGLSAEDEKDFSITFPEKHPNQDFAGKQGDFHVKVHQVLEAMLPDDETFYKKIELVDGTPEKLRLEVAKQLDNELTDRINQRVKEQLMYALPKHYALDLPEGLLARELQRLEKILPEMDRNQQEQKAKENVMLSLIFGEVIKTHKLEVSSEEEVKTYVLEALVMNKILEKVTVLEKQSSYEEIKGS